MQLSRKINRLKYVISSSSFMMVYDISRMSMSTSGILFSPVSFAVGMETDSFFMEMYSWLIVYSSSTPFSLVSWVQTAPNTQVIFLVWNIHDRILFTSFLKRSPRLGNENEI